MKTFTEYLQRKDEAWFGFGKKQPPPPPQQIGLPEKSPEQKQEEEMLFAIGGLQQLHQLHQNLPEIFRELKTSYPQAFGVLNHLMDAKMKADYQSIYTSKSINPAKEWVESAMQQWKTIKPLVDAVKKEAAQAGKNFIVTQLEELENYMNKYGGI